MKKTIVAAVLFLSGCTPIHFDNGIDVGTPAAEKWHHNIVLALYEFSEPLDLERECGEKEWSSVKTELSVINWLASAITSYIGPWWYPKTVTVSCSR